MEREEFIRKMLMLGAELEKTSDNFRISMIVNDAEILTKKYESELKKLRVGDVIKDEVMVCVSCDEQKETHELCMDCVKKLIEENQQTDL